MMEQQVLDELFPYAERFLIKPYMGHTLGASGALETAFLIERLQNEGTKCGPFFKLFFGVWR